MTNFSLQNPTHKNLFFGLITVLLMSLFVFVYTSKKDSRKDKPSVVLSVPGIGVLPELRLAMLKDRNLRVRVHVLMDFDEYYLFSNYKEINTRVSEILFLWSGLKISDLEKMTSDQAIEHFLRRAHGMSDNAPVKGSPYLPENPWPHYFNNVKSRLLMLGNGRNIYDGVAYYDVSADRTVVEGSLSEKFLKEFKKFLKTRKDARRFRNNFLVFVDETKGLKNLSDEEKDLVKDL